MKSWPFWISFLIQKLFAYEITVFPLLTALLINSLYLPNKQTPYLKEFLKSHNTFFCHYNNFYTHQLDIHHLYTWNNLAAHGDGLEGFSGWLRIRNLTLWHNFAAWCYWLKSRIAMRTKSNFLGCRHFGGCSFQWRWQRIKSSVSLSFSIGWEAYLKWNRQMVGHESLRHTETFPLWLKNETIKIPSHFNNHLNHFPVKYIQLTVFINRSIHINRWNVNYQFRIILLKCFFQKIRKHINYKAQTI